jgi:hypothetical protein
MIASVALGHVRPWEWSFLGAQLLLLAAGIAWLTATGREPASAGRRGRLSAAVARLADGLERTSGLPAWCAGAIWLGLWSLLVAALGFYWDVAWHVDLGRDVQLFTPPHVLILVGLFGIGMTSLVAIGLASLPGARDAGPGLRLGPLRAPFSAIALGCLSLVALIGFPLDDLWHAVYGVDVTMWSPTHLMMIGSASVGPVALALMLAEGGAGAARPRLQRAIAFRLAAAVVIGLSTFQLEFDMGVPQWQALYQPVLVMAATGLALTGARVALGRGGAVLTALSFLFIRGLWALLIGGLGLTAPRFPLYLGVALAVEAGAWLARRRRLAPLPSALAMGAAAGTVGLASEWAFSQLWSRVPWQPGMLPRLWVATLAAVAAAVLGTAAGRVLARRRPEIPPSALALAALALGVSLAIPFPRSAAPLRAHLATAAAGPAHLGVDQYGMPALLQPRSVELTLDRPDAVAGADWFRLVSWQGGSAANTRLLPDGPGRWRSATAVPTGGTWKTLVMLARGPEFEAIPVSMPADPTSGQPAIAAPAAADYTFVPASAYLLRPRPGTSLVGPAVTAVFALSAAFVVLVLLLGFMALARTTPAPGPTGARTTALPGPRPPRLRSSRRRPQPSHP